MKPGLLETLRALEVALHQPSVRRDRGRLERLLHPDFREFGRSGRAYDRAELLELLPQERQPDQVWSQDFALQPLAAGSALLTYRSARIAADGTLERHTNRSSVWQLTSEGWRMLFHQGTPTAPFEKQAGMTQ
jgi:hypothetical protein